MADTKITALTADATPSSDDLVVTVNDPGGTPANRKVTLANLHKGMDVSTKALDNLASVAINTSLISDTDVTDDLGSQAIRWNNAYVATVSTGDTATDTLKIRGYDVDGAAYVDVLTVTANNTVTADLNAITTIGGNAIIDSTDAASTTAAGIVELATNAEAITGTDTARAVTPAGVQAKIDDGAIAFAASRVLGAKAAGDTAYTAMTTAQLKTLTGYLTDVVDDTTPQLGGALDGQGNDLNNLGVVFLTEQAAAEADVAGKGQFWVKDDTPNIPKFTDDAGTDFNVVLDTKAQTVTQKNIQDYSVESGTASSGATITLDYTNGPDFSITLGNGDSSTLAFSNWPASGVLGKITVQINQNGTGASTLAWTNVDAWAGGSAPTMTATLSAIDEYVFWTRDGGTTVYGAVIGQAFA